MRMSRTVLGEHCGAVPLCYSTLCQGNKVKYVFIAQHKKTWPVDLMCRLLGVTRSGYYGHQRRGRDRFDPHHQELLEAVRDIAKATEDSYGSRRMKAALNALSYPVSRNKARKLMKEAGVQVKHRKKLVLRRFIWISGWSPRGYRSGKSWS
jgi:putative transposase